MKVLRYLTVLLTLTIILMLQACGSGKSDTSGALTINDPTITDNKDGTSTVSFNTTYTPPPGKTAQGVVVKISINGNAFDHTFTSLSNTVRTGDIFLNGTVVSVVASIGDMVSSTIFVVPVVAATGGGAGLTLSTSTASFLTTDAANSTKTITVSGGTSPYTVLSSIPADITASIVSGTITIKLINASVAGTPSNAIVSVTDSAAATLPITVTYFK